jgi:hypothetical protein
MGRDARRRAVWSALNDICVPALAFLQKTCSGYLRRRLILAKM